jgi:exodeoxyribonuclease V alpha subunit
MPTHLSARVAWHMDGWNGHICQNPASNHYCIGPHSYPGDKIKGSRDLNAEQAVAGKSCSEISLIPPCIYSINAFGSKPLTAYDDPPSFFRSGQRTEWNLPPATVCAWPYEAMYDEEAKTGGYVDNAKRLELAKEFFSAIEAQKSLVFHYANYSNPFSSQDAKKYVVVGVSRVKKLGELKYFNDTDEETKKKYAGGFIWQMNVETLYPDQGMRIPYHRYLNAPDAFEKIALIPENSRCFKFGSRHVSDDDALSLIERFIEIATYLRDVQRDESEHWGLRLDWLNGLLGELWQSRGLFPGFARVLDIVGLSKGISTFRNRVSSGKEKEFRSQVLDWLNGKSAKLPSGIALEKTEADKVRRQWKLRTADEQQILSDVLPAFDLPKEQMERILSDDRAKNCIEVTLNEIADNPYILSEQFVGDGPDDTIPFSRIDHGIYPAPDLGGEFAYDLDDWRRLRALSVDRLQYETKHSFLTQNQLLADVNSRLSVLPEWKRVAFKNKYFEVDRETLEQALVFRQEEEIDYVYLRRVYEAEREIETCIRKLAASSQILFKSPVTEQYWRDLLYDTASPLAEKSAGEYRAAIAKQASVCAGIFSRPVSVICGAAGTGKTTVIRSLLQAVEKAHSANATFLLLAPTGKAADRIREKTNKDASTIHSFLARRGWLNDNLTIRKSGGNREEGVTTYVIDEASMLDLEITAALFRAINWNSVQRLIIVGDPNQLPPIGRGRVFADILAWLRKSHSDAVGELAVNLRQMENRVTGKGTGILDLASVYVRPPVSVVKNEDDALRAEEIFKRLQDLPPDGSLDKDLRVLFWNDPGDLMSKLVSRMIADMEEDTGQKLDKENAHNLWMTALRGKDKNPRPEYHQILSPYRHEEFGTEAVNLRIQEEYRGASLTRIGQLAGITLFDKVIQIRNRGVSDPIWAYNHKSGQNEQANIFNGELGFAVPHPFDKGAWKIPEKTYFRLKHFQVRFSRKEHLAYGYGKDLGYVIGKNGKKRFLPKEEPEDNLELAYAISVHKAQGSEFERVYFIVPKQKTALLSPELFYTGATRATRHCTILVEQDISPLLKIYRPEASHLVGINSSLFEFTPVPPGFETLRREGYLQEYKIHRTLADVMVRSKSEVIIANMLFDRDIPFEYEKPLYAKDGSFYLPDFTIHWRGDTYFWEHLGLLHRDEYKKKWNAKRAWYQAHYPGALITTKESGELSLEAKQLIETHFS